MATQMLVETFEEVETVGPEMELDNCDEAIALIEQLGLKGQAKPKQKADGTRVLSPYRKITAGESFVVRMITPETTKLVDYGSGPIPLRVLQVAAHAKDHFKTLFVCHPKALVKDPFLIGYTGDYDWSPWIQSDRIFILARWGAELASWPELMAKAASMYRDQFKAALAKVAMQIQGGPALIDTTPDAVICARGLEFPMIANFEA